MLLMTESCADHNAKCTFHCHNVFTVYILEHLFSTVGSHYIPYIVSVKPKLTDFFKKICFILFSDYTSISGVSEFCNI